MILDMFVYRLARTALRYETVRSKRIIRVLLHENYLFFKLLHKHRLDDIERTFSNAGYVRLLALLALHLLTFDIEEQKERMLAVYALRIQSFDCVDDVQ